jgi:hypothetical protein
MAVVTTNQGMAHLFPLQLPAWRPIEVADGQQNALMHLRIELCV